MFAYDMETGTEVPRQKSPLEEGVWLMSSGATEVKPPTFDPKTHTISFNGSKWVKEKIPEPEPEPEPYVETYADKRLFAYGPPQFQIEFITEKGLDAWKTKVSEIKLKHPKE